MNTLLIIIITFCIESTLSVPSPKVQDNRDDIICIWLVITVHYHYHYTNQSHTISISIIHNTL